MSLYQKYRPQTFEDVSGQTQAVSFLENIVEKSKNQEIIPHAYIFAGSHGIGKTTLARIFAKSLETNQIDIIELDAASTSRKIENMREMIESTSLLPVMSKYKVYILDEAHALTKDASNAFLKTLEEPFSTNIFILCTTNLNSLLPTIKSRCNILELLSPTNKDIIDRLKYIIKSESNLNPSSEVVLHDIFSPEETEKILNLIADNSNRSYRDSITNLEKVIHTFKNNNQSITFQQVSSLFKVRQNSFYKDIFVNMINNNIQEVLSIINNIFGQNTSPSYNNFLDFIRGGMLMKQKIEDYKIVEDNILTYQEIFKDEKILKAFNSRNLLYFLEKESIYKKSENKQIAWIAICGSFVEDRSSNKIG